MLSVYIFPLFFRFSSFFSVWCVCCMVLLNMIYFADFFTLKVFLINVTSIVGINRNDYDFKIHFTLYYLKFDSYNSMSQFLCRYPFFSFQNLKTLFSQIYNRTCHLFYYPIFKRNWNTVFYQIRLLGTLEP